MTEALLPDDTVADVGPDSMYPVGPAMPIPEGREQEYRDRTAALESYTKKHPEGLPSAIGDAVSAAPKNPLDILKFYGKNAVAGLLGAGSAASFGYSEAAPIAVADAIGAHSLADTLRSAVKELRSQPAYSINKLTTSAGTLLMGGSPIAAEAGGGVIARAMARGAAREIEGASAKALGVAAAEEMVPTLEAIGQSGRAAQIAKSAVSSSGYSALSRLGENIDQLVIDDQPITVARAMAGVPGAALFGFIAGGAGEAAAPVLAKGLAKLGGAMERSGASVGTRLSPAGEKAAESLGIKGSTKSILDQANRIAEVSQGVMSKTAKSAVGARVNPEEVVEAISATGLKVSGTASDAAAIANAVKSYKPAFDAAAARGTAGAWEGAITGFEKYINEIPMSSNARVVVDEISRRTRGVIANSIERVGAVESAGAYRSSMLNRGLADTIRGSLVDAERSVSASGILGDFAKSAVTGAAMGAVGLGGAGAALSAMGIARTAGKVAMASGVGRKVGALAELLGSSVSTQARAENAIRAFVASAVASNSRKGRQASDVPVQRLSRRSYELARDRAEYLTSKQHSVQVQKILNDYADVSPAIASRMMANFSSASNALRVRIPPNQSASGPQNYMSITSVPAPSTLSMREHAFLRQKEVIENPMLLLDKLKNGDLSRDEVDAVREAHPEFYDDIVKNLTSAMIDARTNGKSFSMNHAVQLSIAIGAPLCSIMQPEFIQAVQSVHAEQPQPQNGGRVDRSAIDFDNNEYSTVSQEIQK